MQTLRADLTPSIESLSTISLDGFIVRVIAHDRGYDVHAERPGNPMYTAQCVFVAHDRSLGWAGEQDAGSDLWRALAAEE